MERAERSAISSGLLTIRAVWAAQCQCFAWPVR
jgi:hypothetical protein